MTLPRLLTIAYRIYSWVAVAACLAAAAFLLLLALERPVDIAESTALLIAVAAAALSTGLAKMLRRRVGAVMALLFAAAYALWLLAADPGDTGLLVALLGGVRAGRDGRADMAAAVAVRTLRSACASGASRLGSRAMAQALHIPLLTDRARLPWRFHGRAVAAVLAG